MTRFIIVIILSSAALETIWATSTENVVNELCPKRFQIDIFQFNLWHLVFELWYFTQTMMGGLRIPHRAISNDSCSLSSSLWITTAATTL